MYKEEYGMYFCNVCGDEIVYKEHFPMFKEVHLCSNCSKEWEEEDN